MVVTPTKSRPFVHKFETTHHKYLFDVNTNRVLRTDPVTWDVIDDIGDLSTEQIIRKYAGQYEADAIATACDEIDRIQQTKKLLMPAPTKLATLPELKEKQPNLESMCPLLVLGVTEKCNMKCFYCYRGEGYPSWSGCSNRNMSWETAKLAIDRFIDAPISTDVPAKTIHFHGGEPLLNIQLIKRCVEYIRYKKEVPVDFQVATNGLLLSGRTVSYLAREGFSIHVSMDGPEHIHDYHRLCAAGAPTWTLVTKRIRDFLQKYPRYSDSKWPETLVLKCVLSPLMNMLEVEQFFRAELQKVIGIQIPVMFTFQRAMSPCPTDDLAPEDRVFPGLATLRKQFFNSARTGLFNSDSQSQQGSVLRQLFGGVGLFLHRPLAASGQLMDGQGRLNRMCLGGQQRCFVDVTGTYYPCEQLPPHKGFEIGHVKQGIDAEKSYALKLRFVEMAGEECRYCWCHNFFKCAGCCVDAIDGDDISTRAKQKVCEEYRQKNHQLLQDIYSVFDENPNAFDFLSGSSE